MYNVHQRISYGIGMHQRRTKKNGSFTRQYTPGFISNAWAIADRSTGTVITT